MTDWPNIDEGMGDKLIFDFMGPYPRNFYLQVAAAYDAVVAKLSNDSQHVSPVPTELQYSRKLDVIKFAAIQFTCDPLTHCAGL